MSTLNKCVFVILIDQVPCQTAVIHLEKNRSIMYQQLKLIVYSKSPYCDGN